MRKVPPAIIIAVALIALHMCADFALSTKPWLGFPTWYWLLGAGVRYTVMPLFVVGMLELRQRGAAAGFAAIVVLFAAQVVVANASELPMTHSARQAVNYGFLAAHLVAMGFLARAVGTRRPILAVIAIASAILVAPPQPLAKLIYTALGSSAENFSLVALALRIPELVVIVVVAIELAPASETRPITVAVGFRHTSRALRVFSALTALSGIHALGYPRLLMALTAGSLAWCAYGLLHAASGHMNRGLVTAAATALLWCMSMQLSLLPHSGYGPLDMFTIAFMLVAAAALLSRATASIVDKVQLQAKGIGAIIMFGTAVTLQMFLVPQSQSERATIALDVMTGFVIALGAWALSWLCKFAAERLELADPELPAARIV